ncbi:hypothetical protein P7F88_13730 [Vibrio hannami]|uniref:hypothetical protein n=1 Tax=Vibrio hannami TaxID=2717094 RepID=UPI00241035A4|nr:hypothetical protein [Vibrio hannami]MDG3087099.1 hypothetical protein [Vibrio hannami]
MARYSIVTVVTLFAALVFSPGTVLADTNNTMNYIVTNPSVPDSELTKQQIRAIYLGQRTHWSNGSKIVLIIFPPSEVKHSNFVKYSLGLYPYQYKRRWQKLEFSGFGVKPIEVSSDEEMFEMVASLPGAIGYVEENVIFEGVNYASLK